jgi:uncharacterized protein YbjQ (UPF0145 family)
MEGYTVSEYLGTVHGEAVVGANLVSDFTAGVRDIVGGRSDSYQKPLGRAREEATLDLEAEAEEMGADAVVVVNFDYEEIRGTMLWVNVTGLRSRSSSRDRVHRTATISFDSVESVSTRP